MKWTFNWINLYHFNYIGILFLFLSATIENGFSQEDFFSTKGYPKEKVANEVKRSLVFDFHNETDSSLQFLKEYRRDGLIKKEIDFKDSIYFIFLYNNNRRIKTIETYNFSKNDTNKRKLYSKKTFEYNSNIQFKKSLLYFENKLEVAFYEYDEMGRIKSKLYLLEGDTSDYHTFKYKDLFRDEVEISWTSFNNQVKLIQRNAQQIIMSNHKDYSEFFGYLEDGRLRYYQSVSYGLYSKDDFYSEIYFYQDSLIDKIEYYFNGENDRTMINRYSSGLITEKLILQKSGQKTPRRIKSYYYEFYE